MNMKCKLYMDYKEIFFSLFSSKTTIYFKFQNYDDYDVLSIRRVRNTNTNVITD